MTKQTARELIHWLFPWIAIEPQTLKPLSCQVCGAILVLKLDPERPDTERNYFGHCGTFH